MKKIIYLLVLFSLNLSFADICQRSYQDFGDTSVKTGKFSNSNDCYISVSSLSARNLVYRYHLFISDGEHMVFNSYGDGPSRVDTGARVFAYFPRQEELSYAFTNEELTITLVDGNKVIFDTKNSLIKKSIGFDMREDSLVHPQNLGGVEIVSSRNTYIDFGYRQGANPMSRLESKHKIVRPNKVCFSLNENILKKMGDEVKWLFKTNVEFENYFINFCNEN